MYSFFAIWRRVCSAQCAAEVTLVRINLHVVVNDACIEKSQIKSYENLCIALYWAKVVALATKQMCLIGQINEPIRWLYLVTDNLA